MIVRSEYGIFLIACERSNVDMSDIKDGAHYKTVEIEGIKFEIRYGYESDADRRRGWEPTPQYPDFAKVPQYTKKGTPFALAYGGPCRYYAPIDKDADDDWCANCQRFDQREEFIGLCQAPEHRAKR